jgi:serine/threonine protein kinase
MPLVHASLSLQVLEQCLSALAYLNEKKLAHRDLSTTNILVRSRSPIQVVLADFGLSKNLADLQTDCGTERYRAPDMSERAKPDDKYSAKVDVWSLGVVVCVMLGILPKKPAYPHPRWCLEVIHSVQTSDRLPPELRTFFLEMMLVACPEKRGSAQECHDRVQQLILVFADTQVPNEVVEVSGGREPPVYSSDDTETYDQSTIRPGPGPPVNVAGGPGDDGESTIRPRRCSPAVGADDLGVGEHSMSGRSYTDWDCSSHDTRQWSAVSTSPLPQLGAGSSSKRPAAEALPSSPSSKRRAESKLSES